MIGNNLSRDINGANRFGIRSIHMAWSERYPTTPSQPDEAPTYCIHSPGELVPLIDRLEKELEERDESLYIETKEAL